MGIADCRDHGVKYGHFLIFSLNCFTSRVKIEAILRLCALLTLLMAAIIMITDVQTRLYFGVYKMKVSYKLAVILKITFDADLIFFLIVVKVVAYVVFAIMCASTQIAFLALFGSHDLEWMKLCSKYVRFCVQIGGSIACGGVASILLAVISGISTFNLFRWYSPNFLCLKPKKIGIAAPTTR
ncbi:CASP-like protein XL3 [Chenopodium quinoa]|uniref:CASP-like protein XL3 n=1 Tax=Chenopodium quinoa TaxID=63459 RepID=UPI000B76C02D|nr:CASP-like protein XL3 [Chenopodium quinoa]